MEEFKNPSGTSLLVPSVQELAKDENLSTVPLRYIQPQLEDSILSQVDNSMLEIPIIDIHNLLSKEFGSEELVKLHLACKDWGFFQVVNHDVSSSLVEKVKLEIQDFFNLPMYEKKMFWQTEQHMEGFGQAFVVSEEQKLDWADMFYMTTLPKHSRMPHLFPQLPLPLRAGQAFRLAPQLCMSAPHRFLQTFERHTLELYSQEMKNVGMIIVGQIGKALNVKEMEIQELFKDGIQMMRMNYYPPCPQPEKVIGLTKHSDPVGITILLQLNQVEGLQIKKDGMWVSIKPLPDAFIVNIGDMLEIITNGIYRSIEHRAIVNSEKERVSIATFYSPKQDAIIGPLESLITEQTPSRFRKIGVEEYFIKLFATKLDGKSYIDVMRIEHED